MLATLFFIVAFLLVAFGGLMAAVDSAISVQSRGDIADLAETSRSKKSLLAIAADPGAHINAINFIRIIAETTAAVLVTLAFEHDLRAVVDLAHPVGADHDRRLVRAGRSEPAQRRPGQLDACCCGSTAPLVRFVRVLLGPIADGLVALGNRVTPSRARSAPVASEEQLLSIVDEATEFDVLEEDDRELIHSIFEFNDTVVREVMIPRTDMITDRSPRRTRHGDGPVPQQGRLPHARDRRRPGRGGRHPLPAGCRRSSASRARSAPTR